ncbi:hypothetical protein [Pseudonocardia sp.]|uniref:hypothetical protein n=1 Tax=Pseudonocardia sp. TaxID=60912 RepID=UPI003D0D8C83
MASALIVLLILIGLAALYVDGRRSVPPRREYADGHFGRTEADTYGYDRERQAAELRGMRGYHEDPPRFG